LASPVLFAGAIVYAQCPVYCRTASLLNVHKYQIVAGDNHRRFQTKLNEI
jgi:hypothetical protein